MISVKLLSQDECSRVVSAVHALQDRWIPRRPEPCKFFTLGAASYIDKILEYRRVAAEYNPVLRERFGALLNLVLPALSAHLGAPTRLDDGLAHPGFHILQVPAIFTRPEASIHFDLQYERLEWPMGAQPEFDRTVSFTLPLRLPRKGGGLNTWDFTYSQVRRFHQDTNSQLHVEDLASLKPPPISPIRRAS